MQYSKPTRLYERGGGLGRGRGVGVHLPVHGVDVGVEVAVAVGVTVAVAVGVGEAVGVGLGVPTGTKVHPPLAGPPTPLQKYWLKQLSSLCVPAATPMSPMLPYATSP